MFDGEVVRSTAFTFDVWNYDIEWEKSRFAKGSLGDHGMLLIGQVVRQCRFPGRMVSAINH